MTIAGVITRYGQRTLRGEVNLVIQFQDEEQTRYYTIVPQEISTDVQRIIAPGCRIQVDGVVSLNIEGGCRYIEFFKMKRLADNAPRVETRVLELRSTQ